MWAITPVAAGAIYSRTAKDGSIAFYVYAFLGAIAVITTWRIEDGKSWKDVSEAVEDDEEEGF